METGWPLAGRAICDHARPPPLLLRADDAANNTAETLDGILACDCNSQLAASDERSIWQKDFFDRQLRTSESYRQKWLYVWQNPVVANICDCPERWPWQGELNVLHWHEPAT